MSEAIQSKHNPSKVMLSKVEQKKLDISKDLTNPCSKALIDPSFIGASTIRALTGHHDAHLLDMTVLLNEHIERVKQGDLKIIDELLAVQMITLNSMFNMLAKQAVEVSLVKVMDPLLRLALKAQNQCRATAETLANIKNPSIPTFVKQANIGYNQQVNNDSAKIN